MVAGRSSGPSDLNCKLALCAASSISAARPAAISSIGSLPQQSWRLLSRMLPEICARSPSSLLFFPARTGRNAFARQPALPAELDFESSASARPSFPRHGRLIVGLSEQRPDLFGSIEHAASALRG